MIPLSLWLAERHPPPDVPFIDAAAEEQASPLIDAGEAEPEGGADPVQREEALLSALREAEEKLQQQLLMQMERERELELRLGEELGRRLQSDISRSIEDLLEALEESLVHVLTPFLKEHARQKAIAELAEMVRREIQRSDTPVLEIRAPTRLHDALRAVGEEAKVSIAVAPSEIIEVVLTTERRRFEELSARWLEAIEGMAR
jgi:hypothetical protein